MARVWQLLVRADGDTKAAQKELRALQRSTRQFGKNMTGMGRTLTTAVTAPIVAMGALGVHELRETMEVTKKTDAVFKSMGSSMKVTKSELAKLVSNLESYSAIEGDVIQNAANVGLSFKALAGNPKLFKATTRAAVDMSAALGIDVQQAMVQLGKAMQNGAKGAGALSKNGTLAKDDIEKLQAMAKAGVPMWKQQQYILAAVNKQYAGQGKNVDPIKAITIAVKNTAETMATLLLPALQKFSSFAQMVSEKVQSMSAGQRKLVGVLLLLAAAVGPVLMGLGSMVSASAALLPVIGAISLPVLGIVAALAALGVALVLAYKKSDTFRTFVNRAFTSVRTSVTGVLNSLRATIQQWIVWGSAIWAKYGDQILAVVVPAFNAMRTIIGTQLANLRDVIKLVLALLRGDWGSAWGLLKGIVSRTFTAVVTVAKSGGQILLGVVRALPGMLRGLAGFFYDAGKALGKRVVDAIIDAVKAAGGRIKDAAKDVAGSALDAVTPDALGLGRSVNGGKGGATAKASLALKRANAQAAIDADAGRAYNQALTQYNNAVTALEKARKNKKGVAAAAAKVDDLAKNLVEKRQAKAQAEADKAQADKEAADAEAERQKEAQEKADSDAKEAADKAAQDARDAENFRRRSLGLMSVEEEAELARANEIRAQYGLPPVKSMSEIGSNPTEVSASPAASSAMAPGDTGAGYNGVALTSPSALGAAQSALNRLGITINTNSSDPEAIVRRLLFALGGNRLRMGGGI